MFSCNKTFQKKLFDKSIISKETIIKGKVSNWITDTIYYETLPFHSPHSTSEGFKTLSKDRKFDFTFNNIEKPFILSLTPEKKILEDRSFLLFESFTDKYYRGYCKNFFTMPMTTYLIEPNTETIVELTKESRYGKTNIIFSNNNKYNSEYYQTTFDLDQRFDETVTLAKNRNEAIKNLKNKKTELLKSLNLEKDFISPFLYKYVKAEIEFGARKEFLRYLLLDNKEETALLFKNKISADIISVIDFDKKNIDYATLISQEYNEFIELYLHFKFSEKKKELIIYKKFDLEKFDFAFNKLPENTKYYYLANNLLASEQTSETNRLIKKLIKEFPNGELNNNLLMKKEKTVANTVYN